ncbi:alpha/beta fold hydrolase [Micromonospora peucetia]|uniref:Alpha/beta hydrolase n=1 Tax=Micromonospora peucetia TaxID=47871 RepID=A0ABZ1ECL7_9ACTN|nr:alpha/beta fold hydrolase [Micromonospora peucetia]WSA32590.1 alpha/beta hydrolase [Micromonospora peucetia]
MSTAGPVPLNVATWGAAGGPVCVCLHGITANSSSWARLGPRLAELGFRVLAPELRGHGESPKTADGYDTETLLADLAAVVPAQPDVLIGHSFGGYLAQEGVLRGVFRPRALVLEDPVSHQPDREAPTASLAYDRAHLPRDIEGTLALNPHWTRLDAAGKVLSLEQVNWDGARTAFAGNAPWDLRGAAAQVAAAVPTRWVLPGESRFVPATDVAALRAAVGAESVVVVPHAGHSIHRDDLDRFVDVVTSLHDPRSRT